jgi:cell division septation protein DedD
MNTYSYGASRPIADNSIPSERAKNRRVSLVVMRPATPFTDAQAEKDSIAEDEYVEQDKESEPGLAAEDFISKEPINESEPGRALEDLSLKAVDKGFLIQVGAYRSLAIAENVQRVLQDKGYEAYLDEKTLPELGLLHRVRIRGYMDNAAAKADVERLQNEDGLSPIVVNIEAT